jgi:YfiR/HmsC-like
VICAKLRWRSRVVLAALLTVMIPARSADVYRETAVKAAFIYRFTGYVEWPPANAQPQSFTIAVLGSKPLAEELERLVAGRAIKDRAAQVRIVNSAEQASDAQVLYVGNGFDGDLARAIEPIAGKPVLVVTDDPHGLDAGAALNFVIVDRRVRFDVALPAAQRAGLKISSELLGVAANVRGVQKADTDNARS